VNVHVFPSRQGGLPTVMFCNVKSVPFYPGLPRSQSIESRSAFARRLSTAGGDQRGGVTVRLVLAETAPSIALMTVVPNPPGLARPEAVTVATTVTERRPADSGRDVHYSAVGVGSHRREIACVRPR